jgi:hypothetical protein
MPIYMASSVPCCVESALFADRGAIGAVAAGFTEIGEVTGLSAGAASVSVRLLKIKYATSATTAIAADVQASVFEGTRAGSAGS